MSPLSLASMSFHWKSNSSFSEASLSTPPTLFTQKQIKRARMETASHSYSLHPLHKNKPCASSLLPRGTTQLNIPYAEHFVASGTLSLVTLFALCPICFIIYNTWSIREKAMCTSLLAGCLSLWREHRRPLVIVTWWNLAFVSVSCTILLWAQD